MSLFPKELLSKTPVRVGATAGLRQLKGDASERILESVATLVRSFLRENSTLKSSSDAVTVLDGTQEGAFQWVTINYLLGNLGNKYTKTVGVVDLGGGSVQMAYGISAEDAERAPKPLDGGAYVKELFLKGTKYYLYVHSYLRYGLLAARAEILKEGGGSGNPCILTGYQEHRECPPLEELLPAKAGGNFKYSREGDKEGPEHALSLELSRMVK